MKWILLFLSCLSFVALGVRSLRVANNQKSDSNLSHFDLPLLLGDWYLMNPDPEQGTENFRAIKLTLDSNYSFSIDIQKKDYSVDHWEGLYNANEDTIILGLNTSEPQVYAYSSNHNMLNLNGVMFTKALPNALAESGQVPNCLEAIYVRVTFKKWIWFFNQTSYSCFECPMKKAVKSFVAVFITPKATS